MCVSLKFLLFLFFTEDQRSTEITDGHRQARYFQVMTQLNRCLSPILIATSASIFVRTSDISKTNQIILFQMIRFYSQFFLERKIRSITHSIKQYFIYITYFLSTINSLQKYQNIKIHLWIHNINLIKMNEKIFSYFSPKRFSSRFSPWYSIS